MWGPQEENMHQTVPAMDRDIFKPGQLAHRTL